LSRENRPLHGQRSTPNRFARRTSRRGKCSSQARLHQLAARIQDNIATVFNHLSVIQVWTVSLRMFKNSLATYHQKHLVFRWALLPKCLGRKLPTIFDSVPKKARRRIFASASMVCRAQGAVIFSGDIWQFLRRCTLRWRETSQGYLGEFCAHVVRRTQRRMDPSPVRIVSRHSPLSLSCSALFNFLAAERANLNQCRRRSVSPTLMRTVAFSETPNC
jgi:hypothetical protein